MTEEVIAYYAQQFDDNAHPRRLQQSPGPSAPPAQAAAHDQARPGYAIPLPRAAPLAPLSPCTSPARPVLPPWPFLTGSM